MSISLKFFSAAAILALALFLQFLFAGASWHFDLVLAALIAFAFILDFWELLVLDLLAVFLLNWQPAPSVALLVFALIPLAAFLFHKLTQLHGWVGVPLAILAGFLIFYVSVAPSLFFQNLFPLFFDLIISIGAGEIVFVALQ